MPSAPRPAQPVLVSVAQAQDHVNTRRDDGKDADVVLDLSGLFV